MTDMRIAIHPIFDSLPLVATLSAILLALLWIRPAFPSATPTRQRILRWLRTAVIGLLTIAMLRPSLVSLDQQTETTSIVFLIDTSRSMNVSDVGSSTRLSAVKRAIEAAANPMSMLAKKHTFKTYFFDAEAVPVSSDDTLVAVPDVALGNETDIGSSLDRVIQETTGERVAAVFLLSDGAQRSGSSRVDVQQPARELALRDCPLFTIAFGQARDQSQSRDVAVVNLPDQYSVFANNRLIVSASVHVQGFTGQEIPVVLDIVAPDGSTEQLGPIPIVARRADQQVKAEFELLPTQVGQYKVKMRAAPMPSEQVTVNNEQTAFVTVLQGGLRVFYVDGNVGWQERKFIRRALDESPDIQVDAWLDTQSPDEPGDPVVIDELDHYDVFLIGDLAAARLGNENASRIAKAVSDGKGLMMLGGIYSFGPGGYARSPLAPALPVKMSRLEKQVIGEPVRSDVHWDGDISMQPISDHFVTRLTAPLDNAARWKSLPPLHGANQFKKLSDQAVVLAESPDHQPLLVAGKYGLGRVLAMAGDSTFRWYRGGFQEDHQRFWRQSILWLAQKDEQHQDQVWLQMPQRRYQRGARATATVGARDANGALIADAKFELTIDGPDGYQRSVIVNRQENGSTGVTESLTTPGDYQLSVTATRGDSTLGSDRSRFIVVDQDLELSDPAANPQQLRMMADVTAASGGRFIAAEELSSALDELGEREQESTARLQTQWQLADTTQDAGGLFLLLVSLLVGEWYLRKRWKLV